MASDPPPSPTSPTSPTSQRRPRATTDASIVSNASTLLRSASIKLMNADPPLGMWAATGINAARAPSLSDIRRNSFGHDGWQDPAAQERRGSAGERRGSAGERSRPRIGSRGSSGWSGRQRKMSGGAGPGAGAEPFPHVTEEDAGMGIETTHWTPRTGDTQRPPTAEPKAAEKTIAPTTTATTATTDTTSVRDSGDPAAPPVSASPYANGYIPPPKLPWTTSTLIGLKAFWRWFLTIPGFFITLYGLNVVAWGGMLFLLLCNAAPAMCHPSCNHINSARRIWVEITSQILNALFCVTGFGLAPWRFRDLWFLIQARTGWYGPGATKEEKKVNGWRRLAGINRSWFRLPGSDKLSLPSADEVPDELNPALPLPPSKRPDEPLTGVRSPPTKKWKMDFVIWMNVWNTFFQIALCVCMWAYNRIERPAWSTGLFVALACGVAGAAGIMMFVEGKKVKKVEGVPPKVEQKVRDVEEGMEMRDEVDKKGAAKAKKEGEGEGFRKKLSKFSG